MSPNLLKNVVANFIGRGWTALASLIFVPLYIRYLGVESYALTGFFALLSFFMTPIDSAINFTVNKELATLSAKESGSGEIKGLLKTIEVIFLIFSVALGLLIVMLSSFFAVHWINPQQLAVKDVAQAISLMGIALALQWPISFYSSGMLGLQRQVPLNVISVVMATLRGVGAICVLEWVEPTIQAFFLWQVILSFVHMGVMRLALWRCLPKAKGVYQFSLDALKKLSPFALRTGILSLLSFFLINGDKLIISKVASLEQYGFYTLGAALAGSLYFLISPLFASFFPKFCEHVVKNNILEFSLFYFKACQFLAVLVLPVACVLAFFSKDILLLWTRNPVLADQASQVLALLSIGTVLNGLMNMPFALQMAHGWMRLVIIQNIVSVIVLFPLSVFLFHYYGIKGAAWAWLIHNLGCVVICAPLIHRKLMPGVILRWLKECCVIPCLVSGVTVWVGYRLHGYAHTSFILISLIVVTWLAAFVFTLVFTPFSRLWLKRLYVRWSGT